MYLNSPDEYDRKMSGYDVHLVLKSTINKQANMNALIVINVQGKVINWSRNWPIPNIDVSDRDYFEALKTDKTATSFLSKPLQSRGSGTWTIGLGRKVLGPNGQLFGLVLGAMEVRDLGNEFSPSETQA
jgi:hypothetical protein